MWNIYPVFWCCSSRVSFKKTETHHFWSCNFLCYSVLWIKVRIAMCVLHKPGSTPHRDHTHYLLKWKWTVSRCVLLVKEQLRTMSRHESSDVSKWLLPLCLNHQLMQHILKVVWIKLAAISCYRSETFKCNSFFLWDCVYIELSGVGAIGMQACPTTVSAASVLMYHSWI